MLYILWLKLLPLQHYALELKLHIDVFTVKSSTTHPKSDNEEFVNLHNFNYAVEVTLSDVFTTDSLQSAETMKFSDCAPEKLKLPIKSIEADGSYFQLPNTSLETWLSADVRTLFSRGKLYGACKNGRIDSDECVPCVLPSVGDTIFCFLVVV